MRLLTAGVVLGVGLGGFADGIVLHQIAQWHNMGSAILRPDTMEAMSQNMVWDGLFHLATWTITLIGIFMLWMETRTRQAVEAASVLAGQMIVGWGAFNLVEGVVDHHLLNLHHVRDMPVHVPAYDWLFLAVGGVGFIVVGGTLMRAARRRVPAAPSTARPH
jgi:uncharacterized membrane protein